MNVDAVDVVPVSPRSLVPLSHRDWWHGLRSFWRPYRERQRDKRALAGVSNRMREDVGLPRLPEDDAVAALALGMIHIWR